MEKCGVLLPVFSLCGEYGIGSFGREAREFIDFLAAGEQDFWQVLPLTRADKSGSPYSSESAFAGDTDYIDLPSLVENGLLNEAETTALKSSDARVARQREKRKQLLETAFSRFAADSNYESFVEKQGYWLNDYALYMALKEVIGFDWIDWDDRYRLRDKTALEQFERENKKKVDFYRFVQYLFDSQWQALRLYAASKKIEIIGDMPIYVCYESADVWSHPELFVIGEDMSPSLVAGCPPDGFTPDGQLWGNPVYDWQKNEESGFKWWLDRFGRNADLYDIVRLDHFRGFESFFAVKSGEKTARRGEWMSGPGMRLFERVRQKFPRMEIVAEDLGFITDEVRELIKKTGYPNMKVLQFGLDGGKKNEHYPKNYSFQCVAYTGTHDNNTTAGMYGELSLLKKAKVRRLVKAGFSEKFSRAAIRMLFDSKAKYVIVPYTDWIDCGKEGRINTPGSVSAANWSWRMRESPSLSIAEQMAQIKNRYKVK